jgi:bacterioferritin-associated ferredoxin
MVKNKLVCICNSVMEREIIKFLRKGARTTNCCRCIAEIDKIVETHSKSMKRNPQQKIEFD